MPKNLGELLVKENLISPDQLKKAMEMQRVSGGRLSGNLTKLGFIEEKDLTTFLSKQYSVPTIDLDEFEIDQDVLKLVPEEVARKHIIIPVNKAGSTLVIAISDPSNLFAVDDVKFLTNYNIEVVISAEAEIKKAIDKYYQKESLDDVIPDFDFDEYEVVHEEEDEQASDLTASIEDAPVVKLVNFLLSDAIKKRASDIHVEPYEKILRVRYRIDGVLHEIIKPPLKLKNAISSRIKIMSQLDIAERRLPQDGRFKLKLGKNKEIDFRVSVLPTIYGEKVVMRILDKSSLQLDMTKLGFEEEALKAFKDSIIMPYGMVLATGPTGSGKTTTLYSALTELNKPGTNISTAEDPVEYNLLGINQVQIREEIGLTFAAALRAFLRQDPNIIMVGEIRDFETAEIAVKAALTGHMVLSTLHTNDAPSTITRLLNMGIEPFLVASSVLCAIAQRLARRICDKCKKEEDTSKSALIDLGFPEEELPEVKPFKGTGCSNCNNTGFKGRVAIYEVMILKDSIKELILSGATSTELKRKAMEEGMKTLRQSGLTKIKEGITTIEEIARVTAPD